LVLPKQSPCHTGEIAYHFVPMLGIMEQVVGKSKRPPRTASPLENDIPTLLRCTLTRTSRKRFNHEGHEGTQRFSFVFLCLHRAVGTRMTLCGSKSLAHVCLHCKNQLNTKVTNITAQSQAQSRRRSLREDAVPILGIHTHIWAYIPISGHTYPAACC
jgi:hypothetical protein